MLVLHVYVCDSGLEADLVHQFRNGQEWFSSTRRTHQSQPMLSPHHSHIVQLWRASNEMLHTYVLCKHAVMARLYYVSSFLDV